MNSLRHIRPLAAGVGEDAPPQLVIRKLTDSLIDTKVDMIFFVSEVHLPLANQKTGT